MDQHGKNKIVYRVGDSCFKMYNDKWSATNVLQAALAHARMEELGLDVPHLKSIQIIDGKWTIVSEFIEGKTLQQLIDENPKKKDEYIEYFANLHMELLNHRCNKLARQSDKFARYIQECELDAVTRYDLLLKLLNMKEHDYVCHGDFLPENIVINSDGKPYIIDWGRCTQGNRTGDIIQTALLLGLRGYKDFAESYMKKMFAKQDKSVDYFKSWAPIIVASMLPKYEGEEHQKLLELFNQVYNDSVNLNLKEENEEGEE